MRRFLNVLPIMMLLVAGTIVSIQRDNYRHVSQHQQTQIENQQLVITAYDVALAIEKNMRQSDGSYPAIVAPRELGPFLQSGELDGIEIVSASTDMSPHIGTRTLVWLDGSRPEAEGHGPQVVAFDSTGSMIVKVSLVPTRTRFVHHS